MGAGGCSNLQTARKPGKPAEITGAEQGRNRKSRLRTSQSPLPAKDRSNLRASGAPAHEKARRGDPGRASHNFLRLHFYRLLLFQCLRIASCKYQIYDWAICLTLVLYTSISTRAGFARLYPRLSRGSQGVDGRDNGVPATQAQRGFRPGHNDI